MNEIKRDRWILVLCFSAYYINTALLERAGNNFFAWYFGDLLALPALLALSNMILKMLVGYRVKCLTGCVLFAAACALLWEYGAVWLKPQSVCDWRDIMCYLFGAFVYWKIEKELSK